jgi:hypothetical protein
MVRKWSTGPISLSYTTLDLRRDAVYLSPKLSSHTHQLLRHRALRRARRRQAVQGGGLHQGGCFRRHAPLHCAWRGQALPAGGLHQSLKLPAVSTARYVSSASSPTMRRTMHSNSVARPSRPKPWVGSVGVGARTWRRRAGGECWGAPHRHSDRSLYVYMHPAAGHKLCTHSPVWATQQP